MIACLTSYDGWVALSAMAGEHVGHLMAEDGGETALILHDRKQAGSLAWFCLSWSSSNDNAFSGNVHAAILDMDRASSRDLARSARPWRGRRVN